MERLKFHPGEDVHLVNRIYQLRVDRVGNLAQAIHEMDLYTSEQLMNKSCNLHNEARCRFNFSQHIQLVISYPSWTQLKAFLEFCSEDPSCICELAMIPTSLDNEMQALEDSIPAL
jgi:hypothetical protein